MSQLCKYIFWTGVLCISHNLYSQSGYYKNGAGGFGRADASVTDSDSWSLFNNVGSLADSPHNKSVSFSYRNFYAIQGLYSASSAVNYPIGPVNMAMGVFRYGDDLFSEQFILFGAGHKIRHTSIGLSVHYFQFHGEQIGRGEALAFSFGGLTRLNSELAIGAYIFNLNQAKISRITGEKIPTVMNLGIEYKTRSGIKANIEAEKEIDEKVNIRSGLEYGYRQKFFIRTGITTYPFTSSYGIGLNSGRFLINYGVRRSGKLGISHMISVEFLLKNKKHYE